MKTRLLILLLLVSALLIAGCSTTVSPGGKSVTDSSSVNLWKKGSQPDYRNVPKLQNIGSYEICDVVEQFGGENFMHGISIEMYKGELYASYAYNAVKENTYGEQCFWQKSTDGGKTWTDPKEIKAHTTGRSASHGVFFAHSDSLYYMLPAVDFTTGAWVITCELFKFNDEKQDWNYVSDIASGFWPNCAPQKTSEGWIVSGGSGLVYRSNGDDIESPWTKIKIQLTLKASETSCAVSGDNILLIARPKVATYETSSLGKDTTRFKLVVSKSTDGGKSFSSYDYSDIVASPSRTYSGFLSDGRMYVIFNQDYERAESRNRLLIAVGEKGKMNLSKLYVVEEYTRPLSYPYAIEDNGILYIGYSKGVGTGPNVNHNNEVVTLVPISNFN